MSADLRAEMERLARQLWGRPTDTSRDALRFGQHGSKAVDLGKGEWFDHEAGTGGGLRQLYARAGETPPPMDRANGAGWNIAGEYDYRDETGALLFQVVRLVPKTFRQRRPDPGAPDGWIWKLGDVRRVLYRLPDLLAADPSRPVFVCEGEKDVDNLRAIGLVATCNPGGASDGNGKSKWRPEYAKHLRGRDVVILPDNDDVGRNHAEQCRSMLTKVARSIRVLELPGLPDKGDVSDWIAAGGTADALLQLVSDVAEPSQSNDAKPPGATAAEAPTTPTARLGDGHADDDATIAALATLSPLAYERQREAQAERLGVRVSMLDKLVRAASGAADDGLQGKPVDFPEPQPWHEPVNGAALLRTLSRYFSLHTRLPPGAHHSLALWCLHCFCFDRFALTPRLQITAATKEAGKSTLLALVKGVVPKPLETESASEAALFRVIAKARPTLLLDEADTLLRDRDDLRCIVNAGNMPGSGALRCVGEDQEPRTFDVHAPIAIAGIGRLHGTTESRCIRIVMQRRRRTEAIRPMDDRTRAIATRLCRKATRWVKDHATALRAARPDMGDLINRRADLWRPLYAVANVAGGEWPDLARKAQAAIRAASDDDADSIGEQLLRDVRDVFNDWAAERARAGATPDAATEMDSAELVNRLVAIEGRPWANMPGRRSGALTTARLARLLAPFRITPGLIGPKDARRRGYRLLAFADAFERHLA